MERFLLALACLLGVALLAAAEQERPAPETGAAVARHFDPYDASRR